MSLEGKIKGIFPEDNVQERRTLTEEGRLHPCRWKIISAIISAYPYLGLMRHVPLSPHFTEENPESQR